VFESEFFQVEAVYEGVDEPDRVFFFNILVDGIWEEHCLVSVGSVYVFAHGFLVVLKLALSLTVGSEHRKRLFTQPVRGSSESFFRLNMI
jgi:hypothetical protein